MKVLHVIDSGGLYGAENMLLSLMSEQIRIGLLPELVSIGLPGEKPKAIEEQAGRGGYSVRRYTLNRGFDIKGMKSLVAEARARGISVIHSHGYKANILLGALPRSERQLPVVATLHGWVSGNRWGRMKAYELVEKALLPRLDRVVAVSGHMLKGPLLSKYLGARLRVIHNGISTLDNSAPTPGPIDNVVMSEVVEFIEGTIPFVMIGRLSKEKDIGTALHAIANLVKMGESPRLVIFGEGPQKDALESLVVELNIQANVLFAGYCSSVVSSLNLFRSLIISSITEGIPLVVLEAMRAGIPVIGTRVGGIPSIISDKQSGILVPKARPDLLSKAMLRLIRNPDEASVMGAAGQLRQASAFGLEKMAREYLDEYQAVV